jgi:hypothetical protein
VNWVTQATSIFSWQKKAINTCVKVACIIWLLDAQPICVFVVVQKWDLQSFLVFFFLVQFPFNLLFKIFCFKFFWPTHLTDFFVCVFSWSSKIEIDLHFAQKSSKAEFFESKMEILRRQFLTFRNLQSGCIVQ